MNLDAAIDADLDRGRADLAFGRLLDILDRRTPASGVTCRRAGELFPWVAGQLSRAACTEAHVEAIKRFALGLPAHEHPRQRPAEVGVAWFPYVGQDVGRSGFGRVRVTMSTAPADVLPAPLNSVTRASAERALAAVRELAPGVGHVHVTVTPGDGWEGESWGLAVAAATLSHAARRAIPEGFVFSGQVCSPDGGLGEVGSGKAKELLVYEARPLGSLFGTWHAHGPSYERVATLQDVRQKLGLGSLRSTVLAGVQAAQVATQSGRWMDAEAIARRVLSLVDAAPHPGDIVIAPTERASLLTACVAAANHRGESAVAGQLGSEVLALPVGERSALVRALANVLITRVDDLDLRGARDVEARFPAAGIDGVDRIHAQGSVAFLRLLEGRSDEAIRLRSDNLDLSRDVMLDNVLRSEADLSEALWRGGRGEEGYALIERGIARARSNARYVEYIEITLAYACLYAARQARRLGKPADDVRAWLEEGWTNLGGREAPRQGPDPAIRLSIEEALLTGDATTVLQRYGDERETIFRTLVLRMRMLLGDEGALEELRSFPVFAGLSAEEIDRRVVY